MPLAAFSVFTNDVPVLNVVVFVTVLTLPKPALVWTCVAFVAGKFVFGVCICSKLVVALDDTAVFLLLIGAVVAFSVAGSIFVVSSTMPTTLRKPALVLSSHGHNRSPAPLHSVVHLEHEPNSGAHDDFV